MNKATRNEINDLVWLLLVDDKQAETLRFREPWQWAEYFQIPDEIVNDYLIKSHPVKIHL